MKNPIGTFRASYIAALFLVCAPLVLAATPTTDDHLSFATPEAAVDAFVTALEQDDTAALASLLGPGSEDVLSSTKPLQTAIAPSSLPPMRR